MKPTLQLPVKVERILDGDTLEVSVQIGAIIRLRDCWAPELKQPGGEEAATHLRELALYQAGLLEIEYTPGGGFGQIMSFERILGRVNVNGLDLSEAQRAAGHATRERNQ